MRVSRLGLFARLPGDALDYGFVGTEKLPYWRIEFLASVFCNEFGAIAFVTLNPAHRIPEDNGDILRDERGDRSPTDNG